MQVVYFPGIDLYTHIADKALHDQVEYLKILLDPFVGQIVEEYRKQGALDSTYVIFISDHGHTPVLKDESHALAANPMRAPQVVNLSRLQSASSQNQPKCQRLRRYARLPGTYGLCVSCQSRDML